jgi:hypothetical protein
MNKKAFIPKTHRPTVPGSKLQNLSFCLNKEDFSSSKTTSTCVLLISARNDIVPYHFLKELNSREYMRHLYYDDLGIDWDFSFSDGILKIHLKELVIMTTAIYHRHPGISKEHPYYYKHVALFEVLDIWKGSLIGQKRDHYHNFSKAYQGITSIKNAAKTAGNQIVKYPRSFFLKGDFRLLKNRYKGSLIVKSCSNIRSKVVSDEIFNQWDLENTSHLPTLFQEKIDGIDIRVHVCGKTIWSLMVENKDCIDYRYASKGTIKYKQVQLPKEINAFCKSVAQYENNQLIGVDLMKSGNVYFCLESNPGPGWSTFNHSSKTEFAKNVLSKLSRRKS